MINEAYTKLLRKMLNIMKHMSAEEISQKNLAYLEDRICFYERNPQKYGTEFDWSLEGYFEPWVLQISTQVDNWRKQLGMDPLDQVKTEMTSNTSRQKLSSQAAKKLQREMEDWLIEKKGSREHERTV
ncbi:hypothetical protein [Brevibacillus daliensis]|uniref:hypothetical protein n=1 Tax=Brevibacillus daliensis TaxID=2892995 RepID=UPI001E391244|nr:hypothetical protein [Brevibacillus daliensis]